MIGKYKCISFCAYLIILIGSFKCQDDNNIEICFPTSGVYKNYFPPKLSKYDNSNEDIYSVSNDQKISRPIIAYLCTKNETPIANDVLKQNFRNYMISSEPIDGVELNQYRTNSVDCVSDIPDAKIQFCQLASNEYKLSNPRRWDKKYFKISCSIQRKIQRNLLLPNSISVLDKWIIAQGLYHFIVVNNRKNKYHNQCILRKIKFSVEGPKGDINAYTNPIKIYTRMAQLQWIEPSGNFFEVFANHPFNLTLEIIDQDNKRIENGLDSSLLVQVTIRYQEKKFLNEHLVQDFLYSTEAELAGEEVITSKRNYDKVLYKQASKGLVIFSNVIIRDEFEKKFVFLNATLLVPRSGDRQPADYRDFDGSCIVATENGMEYFPDTFCDIFGSDCNLLRDTKTVLTKSYTFVDPCDVEKQLKSVKFVPLKVLGQTASRLLVVDSNEISLVKNQTNTKDIFVTANFEIRGLWVIVVDKDGRRIYSGIDSVLIINAKPFPEDIKLTKDCVGFTTYRGLGKFLGGVTEIGKTAQFQFTAVGMKNHKLLSSQLSNKYIITGEINLAFFGRLNTAGHRDDPDPVLECFTGLAIEDIKNRVPIFGDSFEYLNEFNFSFNWNVYDTEQSYIKTSEIFIDYLYEEEQSEEEVFVSGVIGFGSSKVAHKMNALIEASDMPIIAYREDWKEFIRKNERESVINIAWNYLHQTVFIGSFIQIWQHIIVIQDTDKLLDYDVYFGIVSTYKFNIAYSITIGNQTDLTEEIIAAKMTGIKYVHSVVFAPKQYFLFREAIRLEFAPMHGYQWSALGLSAKQFDWENKHPLCAMKPTCTEAFQGMVLFLMLYNISEYSSDLWYHVNRKYYEMNPADYNGVPTSRSIVVNSAIALGYDAVLSYAHVYEKQLRSGYTIDRQSTVVAFRGLKFEGLTGYVRYSETGHYRVGSINALINIVASSNVRSDFSDYFTHNLLKWLTMSDYYEERMVDHFSRKKRSFKYPTIFEKQNLTELMQILEIPTSTRPVQSRYFNMSYIPRINPNDSRLISRFYLSTYGSIECVTTKLTSTKANKNPEGICLRTEYTIASLYCEASCGGGRLYSNSSTDYRHGECVFTNDCRCRFVSEVNPTASKEIGYKIGYSGQFCQNIICGSCIYGECVAPYNCSCFAGWTGSSCNIAICSDGCVHGKCIDPGHCKCNVGYYGTACTILLGVILGAALSGTATFFLLLLCLIRWVKKKKAVQDELRNLDWLVNWKDVVDKNVVQSGLTTPMTLISALHNDSLYEPMNVYAKRDAVNDAALAVPGYIENTVEWKGNTCYAKKFRRPTLDITYIPFRKEIIYLREIKHPNLVSFIGACLTAPNVCLLLEVVPKGSLAEILYSEDYKLSWHFKFSILRDIASGMEYLHDSRVHSHGHLKSTNCLIDNRWMCKVTGFGVQTMRSVSYSREEVTTMQRSMLWTAPEILRECVTPSNIGSGTRSADVYSFGIILSELCTHDYPFFYELQILSIEELFRLLRDFYDPSNRGVKRLLDTYNYNTLKPIRPALIQAQMPNSYTEKKGILNLINLTTAEEPIARPFFKEVILILNSIHPIRGDLIENLMYLLEHYTNHLEEIVNEKVREVQIEKNKSEELLGRLLPPSIAEELALNHDVLPVKYENVTIFFSDIVGFTTLAKESKPMEIIDLLNDLYTCFDNIIDSFDVYKLETIGDAYCIVSGIPTPSRTHAQEIATMALFILKATNNFPIRHMPDKKLQIRIGIHSGNCVAGVLGIKMPRFCIFGQDVMIAQYMESSGEPNTIQVSGATANILEEFEIYNFMFRSEVEIKFIGVLRTYWLTGKKGLDLNTATASYVVLQTPITSESTKSSKRTSGASEEERGDNEKSKEKALDDRQNRQKDRKKDSFIDDFESDISELSAGRGDGNEGESSYSKSVSLSSSNESIKSKIDVVE